MSGIFANIIINIIVIIDEIDSLSFRLNNLVVKLKYDLRVHSDFWFNSTWESFKMEGFRIWVNSSTTTIILRRTWR